MIAVNKCRLTDFDVIILDLDMPIMNGYEACKKIRAEQAEDQCRITDLLLIKHGESRDINLDAKKPPLIIALSAMINNEIYHRCISVGFDNCSNSSPFSKNV